MRLKEAEQQKQEKDAYSLEHLLLSVFGKCRQKFVLPCSDRGKDTKTRTNVNAGIIAGIQRAQVEGESLPLTFSNPEFGDTGRVPLHSKDG